MSSETLEYISEEKVLNALTWPLVNEAVEEALRAELYKPGDSNSQGDAGIFNQPQRSITFAGTPSKLLLTMPGFIGNYGSQLKYSTLACKLITSFRSNSFLEPPLPNIMANICLFSMETGVLKCVMGGTHITAWRTAAASIVTTKYLYFQRLQLPTSHAIKLAIIGCGVQGRSHAMDMCNTFQVSEVQLWNRTISKAEDLAKDLQAKYGKETKIVIATSAAGAVSQADVICVGTYSREALIEYGMLPKKPIHINTIGAGEVHYGEVGQSIYDHAVVYVDSMENAKTELKGLKANIAGEIGSIINKKLTIDLSSINCITIFQSMGMASEDATVAQHLYEILKK